MGSVGRDQALLANILDGIDADWATGPRSQTKYDVYHFLGNVAALVGASKKGVLFKSFMVSVADVFSKLLPGEMERVIDHCRRAGMAWDDISKLRRRYFRRMGRVSRPPPEQLLKEFFDVYTCFAGMHDPENVGRKFFVANHRKLFLKQCKYIQRGVLSDPPGMNMHVVVRKLTTGFLLYRSLASTSQLEGMHAFMNEVVDRRGRHASLRYKVAMLSARDWAWNAKALAKCGAVPTVHHRDLWERDALYDLVSGTPLAALDIPCLDGWTRLDTSVPPLIPRNIIFAGKETLEGARDPRLQRSEPRPRQRHSATSTTEWLELITASPFPSRLRDQATITTTVQAALANGGSLTPQILFDATGIRASASDIATVTTRVTEGVAVTKALQPLLYRCLAAQLRTPASRDVPRRPQFVESAAVANEEGALTLPGTGGSFSISHDAVPRTAVTMVTAVPVTGSLVASAGVVQGAPPGGVAVLGATPVGADESSAGAAATRSAYAKRTRRNAKNYAKRMQKKKDKMQKKKKRQEYLRAYHQQKKK